eukprot:GSMAST32.ASY1.ANO1.2765.1 assembled CDS
MSNSIVWNIVKANSCFLKKQKHAQFTSEPRNLTAMNCKKYSGLANEKTVGIDFNAELLAESKAMRKAQITKSAPKNLARPNKAVSTYKLARGFRGNVKALRNHTRRFRPDLEKAALARWTKMNTSLRVCRNRKRSRTGYKATK